MIKRKREEEGKRGRDDKIGEEGKKRGRKMREERGKRMAGEEKRGEEEETKRGK